MEEAIALCSDNSYASAFCRPAALIPMTGFGLLQVQPSLHDSKPCQQVNGFASRKYRLCMPWMGA